MTSRSDGRSDGHDGWTFLTNHSHVLVCLARDPTVRIRDLADAVGITERAVLGILSDLEAGGFIVRHREGRRNRYDVQWDRPMRHAVERDHHIGEVLDVLVPARPRRRRAAVADSGRS